MVPASSSSNTCPRRSTGRTPTLRASISRCPPKIGPEARPLVVSSAPEPSRVGTHRRRSCAEQDVPHDIAVGTLDGAVERGHTLVVPHPVQGRDVAEADDRLGIRPERRHVDSVQQPQASAPASQAHDRPDLTVANRLVQVAEPVLVGAGEEAEPVVRVRAHPRAEAPTTRSTPRSAPPAPAPTSWPATPARPRRLASRREAGASASSRGHGSRVARRSGEPAQLPVLRGPPRQVRRNPASTSLTTC
jgi:hypothetical protein